MIPQLVHESITARYHRWLDYAAYLFPGSGIEGEPGDLLGEVLCMLLEKEDAKLLALASTRKGIYTELDFYVLKMIKTNITSPTSPYRYRYRHVPVDTEAGVERTEAPGEAYGEMSGEYSGEYAGEAACRTFAGSAGDTSGDSAGCMFVESVGRTFAGSAARTSVDPHDDPSEEFDRNEQILRRFTLVRELFERLDWSEEERTVFTFRFFHDRPFSEWTGDIPERRLYRIYNRVIARLRRELAGKALY